MYCSLNTLEILNFIALSQGMLTYDTGGFDYFFSWKINFYFY